MNIKFLLLIEIFPKKEVILDSSSSLIFILLFATKPRRVGSKVKVIIKEVINPKFVRYGWKNYFEASLFNIEGLPASSFQTP